MRSAPEGDDAVERSLVGGDGEAEAADPFVVVAVGDEDWLIHDIRFPSNDARRLIACVRQRSPQEVDVL